MRAKAQAVHPRMPLEIMKATAVRELQAADLPERHLPAEQLAVAALQNMDAGRAADAALWLSLASYRYAQEWSRILRSEIGAARAGSLPAIFYQLQDAELDVYRELSFESQLGALARFLRGEETINWDLQQRLEQLFRDGPVDEETVAELVRRKLSARSGGPEETPTASDLSEAYLRHLHARAVEKRERIAAVRALSAAPFASFSIEALRWGLGAFNPRFCSTLANQLSTHKREVIPFLSDPNREVRLNAAVIMGMMPEADQVPRLEQLSANETQRPVRLALAYALARHGQRQRVGELTGALRNCPSEGCDEAMALLNWLPDELNVDVDPEQIVTLAGDLRQTLTVRLFALATLGRIGAKRVLSTRAREMLVGVTREGNRALFNAATGALTKDVGFTRELVLAGLKGPSPAYRPLLARLSRVSVADDLPVLAQLMPRFGAKSGPEPTALIEAAAHVPGREAEVLLLRWFQVHPSLRTQITFRLMARPQLDAETARRLTDASDRDVRLLVKVISRAPDALTLLTGSLRNGPLRERLFATFLAGAVRDPRVKPALWTLVNFRDDTVYPYDARVRHAAMESLLWIALAEMVSTRTPANAPPSVLTLFTNPPGR